MPAKFPFRRVKFRNPSGAFWLKRGVRRSAGRGGVLDEGGRGWEANTHAVADKLGIGSQSFLEVQIVGECVSE